MQQPVCYCCDGNGLLDALGPKEDAFEWHLLTDSSKTGFKVILLNNGNQLPGIPVAPSVSYGGYVCGTKIDQIYRISMAHLWRSVIGLLMGRQGTFTFFFFLSVGQPCHRRSLPRETKCAPRTTCQPTNCVPTIIVHQARVEEQLCEGFA